MSDRFARFPAFPELRTPRLVLREITRDDVDWYLAYYSLPEIVHGEGFPAPADLAAAAAELQHYIVGDFEARTGFRWGLTLPPDRALIGSIGLYAWTDGPPARAELGCDLHPAWWGRGLMSEAISAVVEFGFGPMRLDRIEAWVLPHNERSMRMVERAGFEREALLVQHGTDEHGVACDEWRFGLARPRPADHGPAAANGTPSPS